MCQVSFPLLRRSRLSTSSIRSTPSKQPISFFLLLSAFFLINTLGKRNSINPEDASPNSELIRRLGYSASSKLLIIHADDLGLSRGTNAATFQALENHWVSSASVMVPCAYFDEVARWYRTHQDADLGIHLTLNSEWEDFRWRPLLGWNVPSLLDQNGFFRPNYRLPVDSTDAFSELKEQIDASMTAGLLPTHLDTHMYALLSSENLFETYLRLGNQYNLPLQLNLNERDQDARRIFLVGHRSGIRTHRAFLFDKIIKVPESTSLDFKSWYESYKSQLDTLGPGIYQMTVHLAYDDEEMKGIAKDKGAYGSKWRQLDFDLVKSAQFRRFLTEKGFKIITWKDLGKALEFGQRDLKDL